MKLCSVNSDADWGLNQIVIDNLQKSGIFEFFPVQCEVIPKLLKMNERACTVPRDMCVSAPTGSGKTLSFAVPVINTLIKMPRRRLRALILLPGRELAAQVAKVFENLLLGTDIRLALCTGQTDIEKERQMIMGKDYTEGIASRIDSESTCVEIIVCTPGRLLDHLQTTQGFNVHHLRFLVLDEADRLLGNAFHGWVRQLIRATVTSTQNRKRKSENDDEWYGLDSIHGNLFKKPPLQRLLFSATLTDNPSKLALLGIYSPILVRSSPLSVENGEKSGQLAEDISNIEVRGSLPVNLSESKLQCESADRPLQLICLLLEAFAAGDTAENKHKKNLHRGACCNKADMCIVFSSSVQEATQLCKLLKLLNGQVEGNKDPLLFGGRVEEMSGNVRATEKQATMSACEAGEVRVLIASDHMARGMDLPNIRLVVNYEPPKQAQTYIHRAGRTARANQSGCCVTIVNKGQLGEFRKVRSSIAEEGMSKDSFNELIHKCTIGEVTKSSIQKKYSESLSKLGSLN